MDTVLSHVRASLSAGPNTSSETTQTQREPTEAELKALAMEIDGGEASYYSVDNNAGGWKWDGSMSTLDWAILDH